MIAPRNRQNLSLLFIALALVAGGCKQTPTRKFASSAWQKVTSGPNVYVRIQMLDDLLRRHNLKQMNRNQIKALLGEPQEYPDTPDNQDFYLLQESFHGDNIQNPPYLQVFLVIKWTPRRDGVIELGVSRMEDVPGKKEPLVTYQIL